MGFRSVSRYEVPLRRVVQFSLIAYTVYQDCFQIKGTFGTLGFVKNIALGPSSSNANIVNLLLDAGAVLYCKTNIPQTMMVSYSSFVVASSVRLCCHRTDRSSENP